MNQIYLVPADGRKSFYKKAVLLDDEKGTRILKNYDTQVCKLISGGAFVKMWDGYSATTQRHINAFRDYCRLPGITKKQLESMETGKKYQCMTLEAMGV